MRTLTEHPSPCQVPVDPPSGWYRTRKNLWVNRGGELFAYVNPEGMRRLCSDRRAQAVVVRHMSRRGTFSYEAKIVRGLLWPRSNECAPYNWVVEAVKPWAEAVDDDPEEFVYAAVTDPAALLSVLIRVNEP